MAEVIQVVPIGSTSRVLVRELAEPLVQFGFEVKVGQPLTDPTYAFNKDRDQYHSTAILRRLVPLKGTDFGVIGVAEVDLFLPDGEFVFGEADRQSGVATVSLARLRPERFGGQSNNDLLRARGRVQLFHEALHLVGLSHCHEARCVMFLPQSVADLDRKQLSLCHECRAELARVSK
jgi:archaemetzincin